MKKIYLTTKEKAIFTSDKDQEIILELFNKNNQESFGLNVRCENEIFDIETTLGIGAKNENADRVHQIKIKTGESIYAYCATKDTISYNVKIKN